MMKFIKYAAYFLVLVGALNWGLIGLFGYNLIAAIAGDMTVFARIIYSLVGVGAIITAFTRHDCENVVQEEAYECRSCGL